MPGRTLAEWLDWQETLNPLEIDLGLDRIRRVADSLDLQPPPGAFFLIAGTNGKGSVVNSLHQLCHAQGLVTGTYTSPHLVNYNERVCVGGKPVADRDFVAAFEAIEAVRGDLPLTYFEFGTLAAFWILSRKAVDVWIIEVGLGGRLDATNILEPDFSLITTIDFDHQAFLGDTIEKIAAEKAGILRTEGQGFFGDFDVPDSITRVAEALDVSLQRQGIEFGFEADSDSWSFRCAETTLDNLPLPPGEPQVQLKNQSMALAALAKWRPELLSDHASIARALSGALPAGRFQIVETAAAGGSSKPLTWVLDVGHNPQALRSLGANLQRLQNKPVTAVLGMLADKDIAAVAAAAACVTQWIVTDVPGERGQTGESLQQRLAKHGVQSHVEADVERALQHAVDITPPGETILVFGSFFTVGPALEWLGM